MSDSVASSTGRQRVWADRFADRYRLRLDESLADWLSSEAWRKLGTGEFRAAESVSQLLSDCPGSIWPGFMPPDLLPVLGNEYGDWLCLRIGDDDQVSEIVHWYHGGGDWIPWGRTLPEAIVFQQVRDSLPGRHFRHADAADRVRRSQPDDALFAWAKSFLPVETVKVIEDLDLSDGDSPQSAGNIIERLLATGVAEIPLHAEAILRSLDTPLRRLTPSIAAELGVPWEGQAMGWMYDAELVPETHRAALAEKLRVDPMTLGNQDWGTAAGHAEAVVNARGDLGWALLTLGWSAERDGDAAAAVAHYSLALPASVFADQSVRFRTHGNEEDKFSARRLAVLLRLHPELSITSNEDYWNMWSQACAPQRASAIAGHWRARATAAREAGDFAQAYESLVRVGWDFGIPSISDYGPLLLELAEAAQQAGQSARAAVAATHARCFQRRFA